MANIDMKAVLAYLEGDAAANARTPRTKLVCTLGPASRSVPMLEKLVRAGMNDARFNFSHDMHEYHQETLDAFRQAMQNIGIICAVMLDTKHIKAIVRGLARDPSYENVIPVVEELWRRLAPSGTSHLDGKENLSGQHDGEGAEEDGQLLPSLDHQELQA